MRRIVNAKHPSEMLAGILILHSKLEEIATEAENLHKKNDDGKYLIDLGVENLAKIICCFTNGIDDAKKLKIRDDYLRSLRQFGLYVAKSREDNSIEAKRYISILKGDFMRLMKNIKGKAAFACEEDYLATIKPFCEIIGEEC